MFCIHRGFLAVALAGLLGVCAAPSDAAPAVRQVLLLQSLDRGSLSQDYLTANFRADLDQRNGSPVNVVQVVVGRTGFISAPDQATVDYIRSTYAGRSKPDLIVAFAGPAAVFARQYRQQLFPDTPLLLAGADERYLGATALSDNEASVAVNGDFAGMIDGILQLLPGTRQVFMVTGSGPLANFWRASLEKDFARFHDRLTFDWSGDLPFAEILHRSARLASQSVVFYLAFGNDAAGGAYADERVLSDLHKTASAPMFGIHSVMLGSGVMGGSMISIEDVGRSTAEAAIRILNGAPPRTVRVPAQQRSQPIFDWRELQRWNIPESRLPPGSIVRYREPGLWAAHRSTVLSALGVLALQSLLILGLLYQRRARWRAEADSRRNLALAADASRRATMSALTNSIGHELGQPLGSIMYNAQALRMMTARNLATADTIAEILTDIETQSGHAAQIIDRHRTMLKSHQLDKQPIDVQVVIDETLRLVAHDMGARQMSATVNVSSGPCVIDGDRVLLQQVLLNLVMNAMDAMADTPPHQRRVSISGDVRAADVDISVRDAGPGLPAELLDTLFTPFVTTKARGLGIGLTIVSSIVDAHGGSVVARNNPDGGATVTVTLRRSASTVAAGALQPPFVEQ